MYKEQTRAKKQRRHSIVDGSAVGCPSKLVSIRNNRNWNRNQFRHYPKQNICFGSFGFIPKQRVSMFQLNRKKKQKTNRNSSIGSIFCYFLQKIQDFSVFLVFFSVFLVCFETVCFGCFASIPKHRVSMFRMKRNKQETHPNSLKESRFGYFSENLGLFRFVSVTKQFCLFRLFQCGFETPKQTEIFCFWFHETNRNLFLFVSRTPQSAG